MNELPDTPGRPGGDHDDERMRRLLDAAVSDVEPSEALGSIHARTKVSSMQKKRSWVLGAGAAVVATAATVAAVTVLSDSTTPGGGGDAGPAAGTSPSPRESKKATEKPSPAEEPSGKETAASAAQTVPVYYVGETSRGVRLYREFHRVDLVGGDPVSTALAEAVSTDPSDPDYRTDWPAGVTAAVVDAPPSDVITIDVQTSGKPLRERPGGMSQEEAEIAVEQLIYTAQAAKQSRDPVQFFLDGGRTDTLLGVPVSEPLAQGDPTDVLAQVWIIEPPEGAEVTAPFEVSGLAAAFEANVQWELMQGDRVVKRGFTMAEECCTMAPYSFNVKSVPPGEYTLVVHDSDPSGGEGFAPWQDTKRVTVLP
jgi:hypothetical protein